ncbi:MAG TPA: chorismate synthase [Oscillospiraceae bacterium]|nr:chorismate synthase [Oscillospiraceae bacterium]HPK35970.1 chorismate synthase [Oscillospiraceae bacterium]HPR76942.1 chorismate synthase [Oscillospiraceae bacterium]
MSSCWGQNIRISIFGQSHSEAVGVVIDGLPAGFRIDQEALAAFMTRRAPGQSKLSTSRAEADTPEFVSGLVDGVTCGAPICILIRNTNTRPADYAELKDMPRPGHADYTAGVKYHGFQDPTGGGHFSGRLTAPLCAAGGICLQLLAERNIFIGAHIQSIAGVNDKKFDPVTVSKSDFDKLSHSPLTVIDPKAGEAMEQTILEAKKAGDSVGGVIECAITGLPVGLGDPMFDGMENRISSIVFGIPAVKGIEFGNGFESALLHGSENNDPFIVDGEQIRTKTNNHGGILGGITSGMPLIFRAAIKPTPSIVLPQQTVSLSTHTEKELQIRGRHDPCIVPRAVPVIEAAAALAVFDASMGFKN